MTTQTGGPASSLPIHQLPHWQQARRQQIVDAALQVLTEMDFEQIQITDVVAKAGVARGTMYRYFSSKDHLYAVVLQQWSDIEGGRRRFPAHYTGEQRLRSWIRRFIRAIERQPQFFKAVVALQSTSDTNAAAVMAQVNGATVATVAHYFTALGPERSPDTATMLLAVVNTMMVRAVYQGGSWREVYRLADRFIDEFTPDLDREAEL